MGEFDEIFYIVEELEEDSMVPKNVKEALTIMISHLKTDEELSTKINRALCELEEITDGKELNSDVRIRLLNIATILETL